MPHLTWSRCRGRNGWDPPQDIPADMAAEALNVHFYDGGLGTKRGGSASTGTLTGLSGVLLVIHSWVPGQDAGDRELFLVDNQVTIARMAAGSTSSALTLTDNFNATTKELVQTSFASINGKLFVAYNTTVNRLHVFDPGLSTTKVRRAGMGTPAAATVANTGSGSYAATLRYYKIAFTEQRSSVTVRRSELSPSVSFTPSGSGTHARITKPASLSEDETHWEVYASDDDVLYYGPIATTAVGTTTYDDNETVANYETDYDLAPVAGTNKPFPSVKYLFSNGTRLFGFGVYETSAGDSLTPESGTVYFTPALDASSIHDEERVQDTSSAVGALVLSRSAGGVDRGIAGLGNMIVAFQDRSVFALIPTENAQVPYRRVQYSDSIGAVSHHSIVRAEDELGRPCLYFLDPVQGPYRLGHDGLRWVGKDVKDLWDTANLSATSNVAHGVYHQAKRQVWFWVATGSANTPDRMLVLDVTEQRTDAQGDVRGGWSTWTGDLATCRCSTLMANTLGSTMSLDLKPYAGTVSGLTLLKADTSDADDDGTDFQGYVESGGMVVEPLVLNKAVMRGYLLSTAESGVTITQTFIRNFGDETNRTDSRSIAAAGSETRVLVKFEATGLEDAFLWQVRLGDASAGDATWTLDRWIGEYEGRETR